MCFASTGSGNFGKYSNADVDSEIEALNAAFDDNEREALIKQISQNVLDDNAFIFFGNSETSYIASDKVVDFAVAPSEYYFITVDTDVK